MLTKPLDIDSSELEADPDKLSRDTVFQTLSNSRRRFVIEFLYRTAPDRGVVSLREISEQLAASENGTETVAVTYKQRKRVHTSLYQSHLPKLHKDGIVEYDKRAGTVALTDRARELESYVEGAASPPDTWAVYWLGLGVTSVLVTGLFWAREAALGPLTAGTAGVLVALAVLCSALAYAVVSRRAD